MPKVPEVIQGNGCRVTFRDARDMPEVQDRSVKLMIGASVFLGDKAEWSDYEDLYKAVYLDQGKRVLRNDGHLVIIQTDQYKDGVVVPRNALLTRMVQRQNSWQEELKDSNLSLLDTKIWERKKADFFQPPFSQVLVFGMPKAKRPTAKNNPNYFAGVWRYPQTAGGRLNAYPPDLCSLLIETFTEKGDILLDPFAGTGRLLAMAGRSGREAIGYEIDQDMKPIIQKNFDRGLL